MATVAVLIRLKTNTHPDATKNVRESCKRGDPVDAFDVEARGWDEAQLPPFAKTVLPNFAWLFLYDVSLAKVQRFLFEEHDTADGVRTATSRCVRYRLYRLEIDSVPQAVRDIVAATGRLNIGGPNSDRTWNQLRNFIRNKKSNLTEADIGTTAGDLA